MGDRQVLRAYAERAAGKPGEPIRFVASTDQLARDGLVIDDDAWQLDNYLRNPVFLWSHDYVGRTLPIGRTVELEPGNGTLRSATVFDQGDEFARQVEAKYRGGFLNAVSVGWDTLEAKGGEGPVRAVVTKADLLDISAVPVPGDPKAMIERQRRALAELGAELASLDDDDVAERFYRLGVDLDAATRHFGSLTFHELRERIERAAAERHRARWIWVRDMSDEWVVYEAQTNDERAVLYRATYNVDGTDTLTIGDPVEVTERFEFTPVRQRTHQDSSRGAVPPHATPTLPEGTAWPTDGRTAGGAYIDAAGAGHYPHHSSNGEVVWRGVAAAMVALYTEPATQDRSDEERRGIHTHLARHYRQFGKQPPEFRTARDLSALGHQEIAGLFLEGEDEAMRPSTREKVAALLTEAARALEADDDGTGEGDPPAGDGLSLDADLLSRIRDALPEPVATE